MVHLHWYILQGCPDSCSQILENAVLFLAIQTEFFVHWKVPLKLSAVFI